MADATKVLLLGGAGVAAWYFFWGPGATTTTAPTASTTTPAAPAVTGANTLDAIYGRMVTAAAAPAAGLGVDDWGYFLNAQLSPLGKVAPDPMPIFTAAIPGFARAQLMTAAQYWSVMAPALKSQLGLSGVGLYGLGVIGGLGYWRGQKR